MQEQVLQKVKQYITETEMIKSRCTVIAGVSGGPDSMVNEMIIRKFTGLPILNIVLDNQDGTAGLETRLESFTDILKLKKGVL